MTEIRTKPTNKMAIAGGGQIKLDLTESSAVIRERFLLRIVMICNLCVTRSIHLFICAGSHWELALKRKCFGSASQQMATVLTLPQKFCNKMRAIDRENFTGRKRGELMMVTIGDEQRKRALQVKE